MLTLAADGGPSPVKVVGEGGHASVALAHPACPPRRTTLSSKPTVSTGGVSRAPNAFAPNLHELFL